MRKSEFTKSFFTIGYLVIVTRFFGFIRSLMQMSILGISMFGDIFAGALRLPSYIRRYLGEGGISSIFIPIYNQCDEKDEFANCILSIFTIIGLVIFVILQYYMSDLMYLIFSGWYHNEEKFNILVFLSRFLISSSILHIVFSVYFSLLNAKRKFLQVGKVQLFQNIIIVLILYILFYTNLQSWSENNLSWSFIIAFETGSIISLTYIFFTVRKYNINPKFCTDINIYKKHKKNIKSFFYRLLPNLLSAGSAYLSITISLSAASQLEVGIISCMSYAEKIQQLPVSVLGTVMGNIMLSVFSGEKSIEKRNSISKLGLIYSLLSGFIAAIFIYFHRETILYHIFMSDRFNLDAIYITSKIISVYILAIPGFILLKILQAHVFAKGLSIIPLIASFIGILAEIIVIKYYMIDYMTLIYAIVISIWINIISLLLLMSYFKELRYTVIRTIQNITYMSLLSILVIKYYKYITYTDMSLFNAILNMCIHFIPICIVFLILGYFLLRK